MNVGGQFCGIGTVCASCDSSVTCRTDRMSNRYQKSEDDAYEELLCGSKEHEMSEEDDCNEI